MADYIEARGVRTWYDERGDGDPVVLLHPGGAGVDARAWGPNIDAVAARAGPPVGCSDGAIVALLVALRRPDLARKLVFIAGVFHRKGWSPGVLDPDMEPPEFLSHLYGEISPDGPDHSTRS